jgi:hypothetical protein
MSKWLWENKTFYVHMMVFFGGGGGVVHEIIVKYSNALHPPFKGDGIGWRRSSTDTEEKTVGCIRTVWGSLAQSQLWKAGTWVRIWVASHRNLYPEYKIAHQRAWKGLPLSILAYRLEVVCGQGSLQTQQYALDTTNTSQTNSTALCILHRRSKSHTTLAFLPLIQTLSTTSAVLCVIVQTDYNVLRQTIHLTL